MRNVDEGMLFAVDRRTVMADHSLIVSNPPHDGVDAVKAAPCFGLVPAEVQAKANYPAPEIWLASTEKSEMDEKAHTLRDAGLQVAVVTGEELESVPAQVKVKCFSFTDSGLIASLEDDEIELEYDAPLTSVFCQPAPEQGETSGMPANPLTEGLRRRTSGVFLARDSLTGFGQFRSSHAGSMLEGSGAHPAFLDLYTPHDGKLQRLSVIESDADFSGLGDLQLPRASDNMVMFFEEFKDKFTQANVDRRLADFRPRKRSIVSGVLLSKLLETISPQLKDVSSVDLASRLAYLTVR